MNKIKKILSVFFVTTIMTVLIAMTAYAQNTDSFSYYICDDGTVAISAYNGDAKDVLIPEKIDGMAVTQIADYAFYDDTITTSVKIPATVTYISSFAFCNCSELTAVYIPDSVTYINDSAFVYCNDSLTVYGNKGSYAESYATDYGFAFSESSDFSLPGVTGIVASVTTNDAIKLSWNEIPGATKYKISVMKNGVWELADTVSSCTATINGLDSATEYRFVIKGFRQVFGKEYSSATAKGVTLTTAPDKPEAVPTICTTRAIRLEWNKVDGATGYVVYKMVNGTWQRATVTKGNVYVFSGLAEGSQYKFAVRAYKSFNGKNYYSPFATAKDSVTAETKLQVKSFNVYQSTSSSICMSWYDHECMEYELYRYNRTTGKYDMIAKISETYFEDTGLAEFTHYYYRIVPVYEVNGVIKKGEYTQKRFTTRLKSPEMTLAAMKNYVRVTWSTNKRATGYQIFRAEAQIIDTYYGSYYEVGDFKYIGGYAKTAAFAHNDKTASSDKIYVYRIRAFRKLDGVIYYGDYSDMMASDEIEAIINGATLNPSTKLKVVNAQGSTTVTSYTYYLTDNDIRILNDFEKKHFTADMTRTDKLYYTLLWINQNMHYATDGDWNSIAGQTIVEACFKSKKGQCSQYNGGMAAMMAYLGYDVKLVQGYRGSYPSDYHQHFWVEVYINGNTYIMETGNFESSGYWGYFLAPYDRTSGYIKNYENLGR